jgi:hypothetical protein
MSPLCISSLGSLRTTVPAKLLAVPESTRQVMWSAAGGAGGHDAYANAHRIPVEEDKAANERRYYLHPDAFGQTASKGMESAHGPQTGAEEDLAAAVAAPVGRQAAAQ